MTLADIARTDEQPVTITLPRIAWQIIVQAAESYDRRVPPEQGDGQACLDVIREAIA